MIFVHTLGSALISVGKSRIDPTSERKFALILYLWTEQGGPVSRERLHDLIFPEMPEKNAKHSLRELVYKLRTSGIRFDSNPEGIGLVMEGVRSDQAMVMGSEKLTVAQYRAAAHGLLPGYEPDHSETFAVWLEGYRARATFELSKVFVARLFRARTAGDWATTELAARACLGLEPMHDEATLALAECVAMGGAKSTALALLDQYVKDIGRSPPELRLPAELLRRRLRERPSADYEQRALHPFVGREPEMVVLRERFRAMQKHESHCVVITGERGIGKTRLAQQFLSLAKLEGAKVEQCVSRPQDAHRPMGAFVDLAPLLRRLPGAIGIDPQLLAILDRLTTSPIASNSEATYARDAEAAGLTTQRAIADLVDAIAAECALILVFDDAHWIDSLSARAIAALLSSSQPRRLLIVVTTDEPRQFSSVFRHTKRTSTIALRGLDDEACRMLVDSALGMHDAPDIDRRERIVSRSGKNPLYALSLADESRTAGAELMIPGSLRDDLARRLDALSPQALAFLQTCISLGRQSTVDRVSRALGAPQLDLLMCVSELSDASLIETTETTIRATHPLIADALRERSPPAWLTMVSLRVAAVLREDAAVKRPPRRT